LEAASKELVISYKAYCRITNYFKETGLYMSEKILALGEEYPPEGEELLIETILNLSKSSMEHRPHPPTLRDQHPKSHGYVKGEFIVEKNLPDDFKVGVLKKHTTYPIWIRFSNGGSDGGKFLPDTMGDVRGMAIKLMDVEGEKALDDPSHEGEQDFILMNNSTFFIRDVQGYIDFFPVVKAIQEGRITFNPDGKPKDIPDALKETFQRVAYALQLVQRIKQKQTSSPLEIPYWSATPYKFGKKAMKFSVVPHATDEPFNPETAEDKDNYLREAMTKHLKSRDAYFDFKIQLQTDAVKMPIEDSTIEWSEQESSYTKVATIKIPQQDFNSEERKQQDEKQSFSPWYSLLEHKPLGGVNRARNIYAKLAKIRNDKNLNS
jgi:catalase